MKKVILLFFIFIRFQSLSAQDQSSPTVRWDLQVTDPDFELKNYRLDEGAFKPFLEKTSWRCYTSETEQKGKLQLKKLKCDYSIENAGVVTTVVSCSPERKYSEGFFELFDERKNLTFQLMLTCRTTPN